MKLLDEWHWILRRAWSVRLMLIAAVLSGAEAIFPLFSDSALIPRRVFIPLFFCVTAGALIARFLSQEHDA